MISMQLVTDHRVNRVPIVDRHRLTFGNRETELITSAYAEWNEHTDRLMLIRVPRYAAS